MSMYQIDFEKFCEFVVYLRHIIEEASKKARAINSKISYEALIPRMRFFAREEIDLHWIGPGDGIKKEARDLFILANVSTEKITYFRVAIVSPPTDSSEGDQAFMGLKDSTQLSELFLWIHENA